MLSLQELFSLQGKVALVTGASSGIGRLMALTLAEGGPQSCCSDAIAPRLDADGAGRSSQAGGRAAPLACDLRYREQVEQRARATPRTLFGAPDILVNAAGVNHRPPVENITREMWEETMAINLEAPFVLAQRLAPAMRAQGLGTHHQRLVAAGDPRVQQQRRLRRVQGRRSPP